MKQEVFASQSHSKALICLISAGRLSIGSFGNCERTNVEQSNKGEEGYIYGGGMRRGRWMRRWSGRRWNWKENAAGNQRGSNPVGHARPLAFSFSIFSLQILQFLFHLRVIE